jgi:hypothetical protein
MRFMKFAVALCFTVSLVMLVNYPHPVTGQVAATKSPSGFADGLGPVYTSRPGGGMHCTDCHFKEDVIGGGKKILNDRAVGMDHGYGLSR